MSDTTKPMTLVVLWEHELRQAAEALAGAKIFSSEYFKKKKHAKADRVQFSKVYIAALNASWAALHSIHEHAGSPMTVMCAPKVETYQEGEK